MRVFATIVNGRIASVSEMRIVSDDFDAEALLAEQAAMGLTVIEITDLPEYTGTPESVMGRPVTVNQDGTVASISAKPAPAPQRVILKSEFLDRITLEEHSAFETLMVTSAMARAWWAQLIGRDTVDLDHPRLLAGLAFAKERALDPATPVEARAWPDEATADARIAAMRA